jgi:DNA mismatch endonuclease (patch repair protein)
MKAQRERDTKPELALRRVLFRRGLRYRVHRRAVPTVRRTLDCVFPSEKLAVEVRGCFWHACPQHATWPANNAEWWAEKLARNAERDADTEAQLRRAGWKLLVVWEHEDPERAASRVERSVNGRRRRNAKLRALSKN